MDYTVHGILQARIPQWVAVPFSRGSYQPRDRTQVSHIAGRFFTSRATREAHQLIYSLTNTYVFYLAFFSSVQSLSHVWLFVISGTGALQASLSSTISWGLLKLISTESVMPSNHLVFCCPLLFLLCSIFPSIRVFSNELALHIRWPKYWSFSFSINPSNEYSGFISFRINWFDLLAVQRTLKSFQQHSSKVSILWSSAFMVQPIHDYWKSQSFD